CRGRCDDPVPGAFAPGAAPSDRVLLLSRKVQLRRSRLRRAAHAAAAALHALHAAPAAVRDYARLRHRAPAGRPGCAQPAAGLHHYWITRRDHATAALSPGHEMRIALIDADFSTVEAAGATLSTELTCSNRDQPLLLRYGSPQGDLRADELAGVAPIRMLRKP